MCMSDEEAHETFKRIRWAASGGEPYCPYCGCLEPYALGEKPPRWKCKGCRRKFSVTSQTIFASRKLPIREYLAAIALFVNGVKGLSSLQLGRDLDINAKSAFVMLHKLRQAIEAEQRKPRTLSGEVEVDGAYFGSSTRHPNVRANRTDNRLASDQSKKRQVVVVMRERKGRSLAVAVGKESDAVPLIRSRVASGTIVHADEAAGWDVLHASYDMRRINHSVAYSLDGACTNQAESFFSRLRRSEIGIHHRVGGRYLGRYASEMSWREDYRRTSNGEQWNMVAALALSHGKSNEWCRYWRRRVA